MVVPVELVIVVGVRKKRYDWGYTKANERRKLSVGFGYSWLNFSWFDGVTTCSAYPLSIMPE